MRLIDLQLKPCPFCGGEADINLVFIPGTRAGIEVQAGCDKCGMLKKLRWATDLLGNINLKDLTRTIDNTIIMWNKRAPEKETKKKVLKRTNLKWCPKCLEFLHVEDDNNYCLKCHSELLDSGEWIEVSEEEE